MHNSNKNKIRNQKRESRFKKQVYLQVLGECTHRKILENNLIQEGAYGVKNANIDTITK